jgi:hypothetical protein
MPNIALLNNNQHKQLRVITERGAAYGDAVMSALTFPAEFHSLQSAYPIVFAPGTDGASFDALALFGFEHGENLFLGPDGWDGGIIPLSVERQPFLIGRSGSELNVHVDLDSPRVSTTEGEPVFLSFGGASEYMDRISAVLRTLHEGLEAGRAFTAALQELALIESFVLDVELDDGTEHRLAGFYTVHEERLRELSGEQLARLSRDGHLHAIYMVVASMAQFRGLIARRNRKHAAGV